MVAAEEGRMSSMVGVARGSVRGYQERQRSEPEGAERERAQDITESGWQFEEREPKEGDVEAEARE